MRSLIALVVASFVSPLALQEPAPVPATAATRAHSEHGWTRNVAVLVFEGVELLDFAGPVEVFTNARGWDEPFHVYTVGATRESVRSLNEVTLVPDFTPQDCPPPDVLVIPGGEVACLDGDRPLGHFIRAQAARTEIVFSVCNGVFSLADAGLLDGLEATTHWTAIGWLRNAAPRTVVHENVRFVDNGHIVTAAGISAGIDGALHVVDRVLGRECAKRAARRMEYEWREPPLEASAPLTAVERARRAWYVEDWKTVVDEYRALVAEHPGDALAQTRLGTALAFSRRPLEALEPLERAVSLGSADPRLFDALGFAHSRAGHRAEAVGAFSRAHELDPTSIQVRRSLGSAQAEAGLHREAIENLEAAWAKGRGDAEMLGQIARCHAALGETSKALEWLDLCSIEGHSDLGALLADPLFAALKDEPAFAALLRRAHEAK